MDWITANPTAAIALTVATSGATIAMIKFTLLRHREYVILTKHVAREEKEVWPALDAKITTYHAETLVLFAKSGERYAESEKRNGERFARLEAKMPNGQLDEMQRTLDIILAKMK